MKPLSMPLQILLAGIIAAGGAGLWFNWDQVQERFASILSAETGKVDTDKVTENQAGKKNVRKVPVIVAQVARGSNDETIVAVGTARAKRSVMVYAKSDGVITGFRPGAGDRVLKGDLIFEIENTKAELDVRIARKKLDEARIKLERSEYLKQRRVNSGAQTEDAQTTFDRAQLELKQAEKTLRDLTIAAPFDGVVGIPKVEVGDRITTSTPVISLDDRAELLIEFEVPEKYLARISAGNPISAVTPSYQRLQFSGRIAGIDSRIDPKSRTVKVRAVIPNADDKLRPGMSFAVELALPGRTFPAVPELSLQWRKGESYVWVVADNKARKVLVETIKRLNETILVDGRLALGDLVVVEGVQRLRPGTGVTYLLPKPFVPAVSEQPPIKGNGAGKEQG